MLAPPIGLGIALFLNQKVMGIRLVKSMFFFPFVISQVVVGLVFLGFTILLLACSIRRSACLAWSQLRSYPMKIG